ncbi:MULTISPECIES: response regulator transcription factor [unclassified Ensifer]|uniref:LuxR C-terminal-related transcriptional regulator n=1 Tax=unclassified Ensifer TaxID=2633371 RepID=UPI00046D66F1|nr:MULTISPECIES: response regulator transcription factor [unclassified Ensifer]KQW67264.1 two-component system response regulator [Ensifer sp. Root127]MBD9487977.1 response regulator transcription factor [Ensifer sp. ENS11]MDP9629138.1 DNA-binding NarL/FixJ family response regulator [Ensifer adhaerens]OMQ46589.1 DNA-binding response regulator [Ensifer sp. 1H6]
MRSIALALADDHPLMLAGLVDLFRSKEEFVVVATGSSAEEVLEIGLQTAPEVFIVDIMMPGNIFNTILDLMKRGCRTRFLAFSAMSKSDIAINALKAGASGYVVKGTSPQELIDAVKAVQRGEIFISRDLACKLIEHHRMASLRAAAGPPVKFSLREGQIIAMLTRGCTNRQIAVELKIGEKTVKNHMTALMQKLNVRNRLEVLIATQKLDRDELPAPRH